MSDPQETQATQATREPLRLPFVLRPGPRDQDDPELPLPTTAELAACPPTEALEQAMDAAIEAARAAPEGAPRTAGLERAASSAIWRYKVGLRRDHLRAARVARGAAYADCVCFGQGGRGERLVVALRAEGVLVTDEDGGSCETWAEVCRCPDGQLLGARIEHAAQATADRVRRARVEAIAGAAGIPVAYQGRTREGWLARVVERRGRAQLAQDVLDAIAWWEELMAEEASRERCVLLLSGDPGTGKSTLAATVALGWVDRQQSVLYRTVPQLALALRTAPFRRERPEDPPTEGELLAALLGCDLLVLDDLGVEAIGTEIQASRLLEWLFTVVEGRLSARRPTIVTTNLTSGGAADRYDPRLSSRLYSPSHAVRASFTEPGVRSLRDPAAVDAW